MSQDLNELFDVVDTHDRVMGSASRGEVHTQGLRHRAVHVLIFNCAGMTFLQFRSRTKDLHPGVWDSSCSGHVCSGETYDAAALRELEEELGCIPRMAPRRLFKLEAQPSTGWEFVWVYRLEDEGPFTLHPGEIERGGWFTPQEIDRWLAREPADFAPAFRLLWRGAGGISRVPPEHAPGPQRGGARDPGGKAE